MKNLINFLLILTVLTLLCCNRMNRDPYSDTPTTGIIKIGVDETFKPVAEAELFVFGELYKYAKITPVYCPENECFRLLMADSVHMIIASRPLQKDEMELFSKKHIIPREIKIATDAVALIVNPANTDTLLSLDDLKDIFTGRITDWKQLNSLSKQEKINVVFDNKNSSIVRFAIDSICQGRKLSANLYALDSNLDVVGYVANHANALGLIGVSWISDRDDTTQLSFLKKIRVIALSDLKPATGNNSYQPFQAYIYQGSYPLSRNVYAINAEPRNGLATGFTSFLASDKGQRIILKSGILPATQTVRLVNIRDHF